MKSWQTLKAHVQFKIDRALLWAILTLGTRIAPRSVFFRHYGPDVPIGYAPLNDDDRIQAGDIRSEIDPSTNTYTAWTHRFLYTQDYGDTVREIRKVYNQPRMVIARPK